MKYEIQTATISHGWISTDGEIFDTYEEAKEDLRDFLEEQAQAYFNGYMDELYNPRDWRVAEINKEEI